jgi:hypothetical protein
MNPSLFRVPGATPADSGSQALPIGVGIGGPEIIGNQFLTAVAQWNKARILSKPPEVRRMILLRQQGQGGTFSSEGEALEARRQAARNLNPADFDNLIDVDHAGFNAYETLVLRSLNPLPGESIPMPDLSKLPAPYADLGLGGPQPFTEWLTVPAPGSDAFGVGAQYDPLPSDQRSLGDTWTGIAKRSNMMSTGLYEKVRQLPFGRPLDRWIRVK